MKVSALQQRASAQGADSQAIEEALDDDNPKAALVDLVMACATSGSDADQEFRRELEGMRLKELRERARSVDVDGAAMVVAMDSDDPKQALIQLLIEHRTR